MINKEEIKEICKSGLRTDGAHHKQYSLEEVLKKLGYKLKDIAREMSDEEAILENEDPDEYWEEYNYDGLFWEKGIP